MLGQKYFDLDPKTISPSTYAFLGDAVFELLVRQHVVSKGNSPSAKLHNEAVSRVNAAAQSQAVENLEGVLTQQEKDIIRRGTNSCCGRVPKNSRVEDYRRATGLEVLFGYLYITNQYERCIELFNHIVG